MEGRYGLNRPSHYPIKVTEGGPLHQQQKLVRWKLSRRKLQLPPQFNPETVAGSIKREANFTARITDGVSYLHLKHLCQLTLWTLADIFNMSVMINDIPTKCKLA